MTSLSSFFPTQKEKCLVHGQEYDSYFIGSRWIGCPKCASEIILELDKKRDAELLEEQRNKFISAAYIPERFSDAGIKNYEADTAEKMLVVRNVSEYLKRLRIDIKTAGNLVLSGPTGTGKTHLACAILRTMAYSRFRSRYITSAQMVNELFATWNNKSKSEDQVIENYASYDVLLIDEMGLNDNRSEYAQSYLASVIDARSLVKRPTIITSNLLEDSLEKTIGDRPFDRLCENSLFLECNWESYRRKSKRSAV
jgi:DNA replication protein DnaC